MATNIVPIRRNAGLTRRDPRRIDLFLKTTGKGLMNEEVDEALEWCEVFDANPFTKDIYFFIFGEYGKPDRKVVPVLSVGKYRQIAAKTGNYRPDPAPPRFVYDKALKGPANPAGIVSCEVSVMQYSHGEWHPITSRLKWEERAPLVDNPDAYEWKNTGEIWGDSGKPKKSKVPKADFSGPLVMLSPKKQNWNSMPETMLAKCTEVDAIRKGWPAETAGSYAPEEMDAPHVIDLTAQEIVEEHETKRKLDMIGGEKAVIVDWGTGKLDRVPHGQFVDAVLRWANEQTETATELKVWWQRNEMSRAEFKATNGSDYLGLQRQFEALVKTRLQAEAV